MVSRRKFIQQASILGAAMMLPPTDWLKTHRPLGLQLYTVRDEIKNLSKTLQRVAQAGYTNIETYGYDKRFFFGKTVPEMARLLKQQHLVSTSGHYGLPDMLYEKYYNWDSWKYMLEDALIMGQKYVTIPYLDDQHRTEEDIKRIADRLNKGGELSKAAGITTAYHNHDFEFNQVADSTLYELLLSNTDPKLVKFEADLYWMTYANQQPLDWFKKHPGRFALWHVKDMETPTAAMAKGQTCEVGKGIIDWKKIFAAKQLAGLDVAFVEQEQYRRPVFDCIKTSAVYMKKNLL